MPDEFHIYIHEYTAESTRMLLRLYLLLSMRYEMKKGQAWKMIAELYRIARRRPTVSPYSDMTARVEGFPSAKPSSGCDTM